MENLIEYWRPMNEYPEYKISSLGRVQNKKGRILKCYYHSEGYANIKLVHPVLKKRKQNKIHRLVALAFIPNPENKPQVNHKNKIKDDNRIDNLEWMNASENMKYNFKDMISINFVLEVYDRNKNIPTNKFKQLLLKKPL